MNIASFDSVAAILVIPIGSAALLAVLPGYRLTARLNVVASLATFLSALSLFVIERPPPGPYVLVDDLNIVFIVLNTFVGFTTSIFSASYIAHELETGRLTPVYLRFYHAMYQTMMFGMNLAFVSNNIGLMWVAVEIATLTTVLMVGIYRTHAALEAAWKYFILGSVGIAFALFGTILVYMAARPVMGEGQDGMVWTLLIQHAANFDPALLNVAFIFLLLGYGTKVGLAPLHAWLPDAHAEGPTPISAVLSGLLLNVALYALLRFKILLAANPAAIAPGPLMVTMGLISLLFAAFMLYRRRDIKRLFAYSSIEHMGIIVFAFGMGGPLANFAGLLHMVMHSLTKSAIFYAVGHISQIKGTQRISRIRGLTATHPALGWGLVTGVVAIAGLPPLGIFMSEFLVVSSTFARQPLLAIVLVFGLLLAFGALTLRLTSVAFGEPRGSTKSAEASYVPMFAHLSLVLICGTLSSGAARHMVPTRGTPSWIVWRSTGYAIADRSHAGGPPGPTTQPVAASYSRCFRLDICGKRAGTWTLEPAWPLGRTLNGAHGDYGWTYGRGRHRQPGLPRPHLSFGRQTPPAGASTGARHQ
ncbi:hydrogenase-4 component F [Bradyrhizobium diazoefficiens]